MVLTLMEATAVPQPFWILVAEWMNLSGDHIEIPQLWPSGIQGSHPTCVNIYIYKESAYICILISLSRRFLSHSLVVILQPQEGRDSHNWVSCCLLFKMSLLPRNKWSKVLLSGLFSQVTCSFANSERRTPGSGGRRAKPLPPCPLKPQLRLCRGRCALQTSLQSRLCGALRKGRGSRNAASRAVHSECLFQGLPSDLLQAHAWTFKFTYYLCFLL